MADQFYIHIYNYIYIAISRWWRISSPPAAHQRSSSIGGCPPLPGNSPFSSSSRWYSIFCWVLPHTQEVQLKSAIYLYKPLGQHQLAININREGILKLMSSLPQPDNKMKRKEISTSNEMRSRLCLFIPNNGKKEEYRTNLPANMAKLSTNPNLH